MAKIVFFEFGGWEKSYIKRNLKSHQLTFVPGPITEKNIALAAQAEIIGVFIYSKVGAKQIAKCPRLKMITTFSTGFDHIDIAACAKKKIRVTNVPSYGSYTVAEHAIALILAVAKKIVQSVERTRQGNFSFDGLRTIDLRDKTLGLIGFGKIGSHVAKIATAFGMKVIVFDPYADTSLMDLLGCQSVPMDQLLKTSDVISLHTPLTRETKHIINSSAIAKMKKEVILINTARGGLIDTQALVNALISGRIGGVGLDVLEEEKTIKEEMQLISPEFSGSFDLRTIVANQMLYTKTNVIITPHNAFNSEDALRRILDTGVMNIDAFLHGRLVNAIP